MGDVSTMLVDVLTSASSWNTEQPLLTYLVPAGLEAEVRIGQLVAVPYGDRLVEGIVWNIQEDQDGSSLPGVAEGDPEIVLRPLQAVLDPEPALWPYQQALAEWIAQYYITPLAQVVQIMLPPGLMQRSQVVLRLAEGYQNGNEQAAEDISLQLRALIGLLQVDGELDVEQLKKMLGHKHATKLLKEAQKSGLIAHDAQLSAPKAKPRFKRIVRLVAQGEALTEWRKRKEEQLQQTLAIAEPVQRESDIVHQPPANKKNQKRESLNPWAMSGMTATLAPTSQDEASLVAQRQLAAIDLLQQSIGTSVHWTPAMLNKATALKPAQLQQLVSEKIIAFEKTEVRRDPLSGRTIPASTPLTLTIDQQQALEQILASMREYKSEEA